MTAGVLGLPPVVGVALVLAKFFGENRRGAPTTSDLLLAGGLTVVPLVFIAREPLGAPPVPLEDRREPRLRLRVPREVIHRADVLFEFPERKLIHGLAVAGRHARQLPVHLVRHS